MDPRLKGMALVCGLLLMGGQVLGQDPATQRDPAAKDRAGQQEGKVCLASKVKDMTVKDSEGQACGQIADLVISSEGEVKYLAVSANSPTGATGREARPTDGEKSAPDASRNATGQNGKLTLVPWDAAEFHEGESAVQSYVALNIAKTKLQQAPTFTRQELTAKTGQQQWMARVDQFFGREGAARPNLNDPKEDQRENESRRQND